MPSQPPAAELASIRAIGTAVPPGVIDRGAAESVLTRLHALDGSSRRRLRAVLAGSAIATRHSVLLAEDGSFVSGFGAALAGETGAGVPGTAARMALFAREAPGLALAAAADALAKPGAPSRELIRHVFVTTCTGFMAPGLDVALVQGLSLRADVGRTLVGFQGCQAGLTALRLADHLCRAEPDAAALIVSIELCTPHFQREPTDDNLLANALFADGAAAVIVAGAAIPQVEPAFIICHTATILHPGSSHEMTWAVGDTGFTLHLGRLIPDILGVDAGPLLAAQFEGLATPRERARWTFAVHPGGAAILDSLERRLELPPLAASRRVLERYGNMSSPTVHFVLADLLDDLAVAGPCLALAFGPGLTLEAAHLEKTPPAA